jgi:hypothetical protein
MNASKIIDQLVTAGAAPVLEEAHFTKSKFDFHRRQGSVVQVVNFQRSEHNSVGESTFFVNVGIAFDELWRAQGLDLNGSNHRYLEKPLEHQCHFRSRLESLIADCPRWWVVSNRDVSFNRGKSLTRGQEVITAPDDIALAEHLLTDCMNRLIVELDRIDSPKTYLAHRWREVSPNQGVTQQLARLLDGNGFKSLVGH